MSCLIDKAREAVDIASARVAALGLHPYSVNVLVVATTPVDVFGEGGTTTRTETRLLMGDGYTVKDGYLNPCVRQVTSKEVFLSNGQYQDTDFKIGPLVYMYTNCAGFPAGQPYEISQPIISSDTKTSLYYQITGPDFPNGGNFKLISTKADSNISYYLIVRHTGELHV